jgi:hypothetical protein
MNGPTTLSIKTLSKTTLSITKVKKSPERVISFCTQAHKLIQVMDKLQLTGRDLDRVFNSRSGCVFAMQLSCFETKLHN